MSQAAAAMQMYEYFKQNRATLPGNISCQREFILKALNNGEEISEVFAQASRNAESVSTLRPKKLKISKILIRRK
jgi:ribosomal protein L22